MRNDNFTEDWLGGLGEPMERRDVRRDWEWIMDGIMDVWPQVVCSVPLDFGTNALWLELSISGLGRSGSV